MQLPNRSSDSDTICSHTHRWSTQTLSRILTEAEEAERSTRCPYWELSCELGSHISLAELSRRALKTGLDVAGDRKSWAMKKMSVVETMLVA